MPPIAARCAISSRSVTGSEQQALYERQSAERGDMESHYRWFAPRRRLEDTVRLAASLPAERVLEVGCGDGVLLAAVVRALPAPPERVVGAEIARGRLARARERVRADFANAAAEALPFRESCFDLVICAE